MPCMLCCVCVYSCAYSSADAFNHSCKAPQTRLPLTCLVDMDTLTMRVTCQLLCACLLIVSSSHACCAAVLL